MILGRLIFGRLNLGNEKDDLDLEDDEDLDEVEDDLTDAFLTSKFREDLELELLLVEVDEPDLIHLIVGEA